MGLRLGLNKKFTVDSVITVLALIIIGICGLAINVLIQKQFNKDMIIEISDNEVIVKRPNDSKTNKALHGLTRSLLANMVEGVSKGYEKRLEIVGVGYRAKAAKNKITLSLGYSHPIEYTATEGIEFKMDEENKNIIIGLQMSLYLKVQIHLLK